MQKFLVGYDGSDTSRKALALARNHAEVFGAKLFVIASMGGGSGETPEKINKATEDLKFAQNYVAEKNIPCETRQSAKGRAPGEDLVVFAEENDIDLIFVGVKKRSRTQKILLGSNAQFIILKASCPVVTIK